jgi:predicted CXXCH cytochrome family protein
MRQRREGAGAELDPTHRMGRDGWGTQVVWMVGLVGVLLAAAWMGRGAGVAAAGAVGAVGAPALPMGLSGDLVCARCHQAIYASYERTSMARGSGRLGAPGTLVPGEFVHAASGIRYRVFLRDGDAWMSYDRDGGRASLQMFDLEHPAQVGSRAAGGELHGERRLEYFVGSGTHGRTYLYQVAGTWFELPINYYTRRAGWGMAPAFDQARTMPADLPADPNCLFCHVTGVGVVAAGSRSHYEGVPFREGGVGCSACHGDPSAHLAANGKGPIVNPGKLDAGRRESACLACHLEGDALVYRAGKSLAGFKAGEDFAGTAVVFVRASREGGGGRAASQYEALLRSACRRAVGDRLTCTSCHDPHASPAPEERVAYYRGKCLACHTGVEMATAHHPEQQDCAVCHMPTRATTDISHEQTVDHDIERVPVAASEKAARTGETLLPVGGWKSSDRELGLAYAQMAGRGDRAAGERAVALLSAAEAAGASDAVLHAQMGFLRQMRGERDQAREEYLAALKQDPYEAGALGNLAVLDATTGHVADAVGLLDRLIGADPTQTAAGLNLAFIECRLGEGERARGTLATLARYNPDDAALRAFAETGKYGGQHCDLAAGGAAGHGR